MLFSAKKVYLTFYLCIYFVCLITCPVAHASQGSAPAFWKVTGKGEATVYLMGSMHFGHPNFYPLPKIILDKFSTSEKLIVEIDITKIQPMAAMAAIMKHGRLAPGQTLNALLSEKTRNALKAHCVKNGLSLATMQPFQPWFAALQIVEGELRKTPFKQHLGLDMYFLNRSKGKTVVALETLDGQLSLFAGLDVKAQDSFLLQTLTDLSQSNGYLYKLAAQWQSGDASGMAQSLIEPFKADVNTRALFDALFTRRNITMTKAVEGLLKGNGSTFFIVGAGHLVGEEGIVDQLKTKGYKVQRVGVGKVHSSKVLHSLSTTKVGEGVKPSNVEPTLIPPVKKPSRRGGVKK